MIVTKQEYDLILEGLSRIRQTKSKSTKEKLAVLVNKLKTQPTLRFHFK